MKQIPLWRRIVRGVSLRLTVLLIIYFILIPILGRNDADWQPGKVNADAYLRRNYLIYKLNSISHPHDVISSGNEELNGEWAIGSYSMATAALTNIAMLDPSTKEESAKAIAGWINACLKPATYYFDQMNWNENPLAPEVLAGLNGHLGYYGHLNFMLGAYALLNGDGRFKDLHVALSDAIARRMKAHSHRHVETYPFQNYPPDNTVAVASLKIADMVLKRGYQPVIEEWLAATKKLELAPSGLLPFLIDSQTGEALQTYRGSNNGWNTFYLPFVDEAYAAVQYERLKKHLLRRAPGYAGVREYPHGSWFASDRDSGPVVFGIGATATVFTVAGATRDGDYALRTALLRVAEFGGWSVTKGNERRYRNFPIIGDAIALAMKTAIPWHPLTP